MGRAFSIAISLLILGLLWWRVDVLAIVDAARGADPLWLAAGVCAVIPLTVGTALRFRMLSRTALGMGAAMRLILSASTLNLFLPSKLGDLAKGWVLGRRYGYDPGLALALVVFEKLLDLASLLFWGVLALLWMRPHDPLFLAGAAVSALMLMLLAAMLSPWAAAMGLARLAHLLPARLAAPAATMAEQWRGLTGWFWGERRRAIHTILLSLMLWAGHLAQFWLFTRALGVVPLIGNMAAATLSILAGLLPFTMAGIGTRDAAIVYFYHGWLSPGQCAMLGVLATLRYVLPALAGLPFVGDYWHRRRGAEAA